MSGTLPPAPRLGQLLRQTLVVMAGVALAIIIWQLLPLLLLLFASILAGMMFHDLAETLRARLKLPFGIALALAVIVPLGLIVTIFALFGSLMAEQFALLAEQLPAAIRTLRGWIDDNRFGRQFVEGLNGYAPQAETVVGLIRATLSNVGSGISALAIVLVGGVYLAAQPRLYLDGTRDLLTRIGIPQAGATLAALHRGLGAWLKGQAVGMAFVAIGTSVGLGLVGLPSALAIGLVAGLCEFVPYLGVILVSLPAVAIGFSLGVKTGVLTVLALVIVQQLQGNLVTPMAQGKFSDLPPALTIFSLIGFGTLLGPAGVVLAVPLTVVTMVLVKAAMASVSAPPAAPD